MNDAQAVPGGSLLPASTDIFTIGVFVLIALFAVAAIAIIVSGARRKRRRVAAEEVVQERIDQAEDAPPPAAASPFAAPVQPVGPPPTPTNPPPTFVPPASSVGDPEPGDTPEALTTTSNDDPAQGSVTQLKGLGPKVATQLAASGITTVGDLARLSPEEAARLDAKLGAFSGRMERDRWLEQARLLAAGDRAGFEAVFGRL